MMDEHAITSMRDERHREMLIGCRCGEGMRLAFHAIEDARDFLSQHLGVEQRAMLARHRPDSGTVYAVSMAEWQLAQTRPVRTALLWLQGRDVISHPRPALQPSTGPQNR